MQFLTVEPALSENPSTLDEQDVPPHVLGRGMKMRPELIAEQPQRGNHGIENAHIVTPANPAAVC